MLFPWNVVRDLEWSPAVRSERAGAVGQCDIMRTRYRYHPFVNGRYEVAEYIPLYMPVLQPMSELSPPPSIVLFSADSLNSEWRTPRSRLGCRAPSACSRRGAGQRPSYAHSREQRPRVAACTPRYCNR